MTGDKGSDVSNRLKRPGKLSTTRTSKSTASSASLSAPPKAALASGNVKKDEVHRRNDPFSEILLKKSRKDPSPSAVDEDDHQHERKVSIDRLQGLQPSNRMNELERALALSLEEQNLLREELGRAKQQENARREIVEDYQRQLTDVRTPRPESMDLHNELQKALEAQARLAHERSALLEMNHELRARLADLQEEFAEQEVLKTRTEREAYRSDSEWHELTRRLHQSEKESQDRLQQLLELKTSVSRLTREDGQVADNELAERLDQLYHRIREWVISSYRRSHLNLHTLPKDVAKCLESINPGYLTTPPTERISLYQAVVASNIMYIFKEPVCVGLPDTGPLAALPSLARFIHDSGPHYQEWRRTTVRALENSQAKVILAEGRAKLLHELSSGIEHVLFSISGISLTPPARSSLIAILQNAAEIQHLILQQKARYRFHFFRHTESEDLLVDSARMDCVNVGEVEDEDEDMDRERVLHFSVFPMLEKLMDEVGEPLEAIVLRARVCCGVG